MSITKVVSYVAADGSAFASQELAELYERSHDARATCYGLGIGLAPPSYSQPFYGHSTFFTATQFVRSHQQYAHVPGHCYYRYKRQLPGYSLVAGSLEEISWQQVVEAQQKEILVGSTTTLTSGGVVRSFYSHLPANHPVLSAPTPAPPVI